MQWANATLQASRVKGNDTTGNALNKQAAFAILAASCEQLNIGVCPGPSTLPGFGAKQRTRHTRSQPTQDFHSSHERTEGSSAQTRDNTRWLGPELPQPPSTQQIPVPPVTPEGLDTAPELSQEAYGAFGCLTSSYTTTTSEVTLLLSLHQPRGRVPSPHP